MLFQSAVIIATLSSAVLGGDFAPLLERNKNPTCIKHKYNANETCEKYAPRYTPELDIAQIPGYYKLHGLDCNNLQPRWPFTTICIPVAPCPLYRGFVYYPVVEGDSCETIAKKFGLSLDSEYIKNEKKCAKPTEKLNVKKSKYFCIPGTVVSSKTA